MDWKFSMGKIRHFWCWLFCLKQTGSTVQTLDEPRKRCMMKAADPRASGLPGLIVSHLSNVDTHTWTSMPGIYSAQSWRCQRTGNCWALSQGFHPHGPGSVIKTSKLLVVKRGVQAEEPPLVSETSEIQSFYLEGTGALGSAPVGAAGHPEPGQTHGRFGAEQWIKETCLSFGRGQREIKGRRKQTNDKKTQWHSEFPEKY